MFFDYTLPPHLIAQHPAARRDESRLLVLDRAADSITHRTFRDLPRLLRPNDLLVLNDTRVIPARVEGTRAATGGKWEGLFLRETPLHQPRWPSFFHRFLTASLSTFRNPSPTTWPRVFSN